MTNEELLKTAIEASLKAGQAIMSVYGTNFDVEIKDDKSPLTIADKNANTIINSFLIDTETPIISEENRQTDYAICNALGIHVISKETNEPLLYNKENLLNPWFLVSKS